MRVRPIRCWLLVGVAASLVVALAPAGAVAEVLSCEFNRQTRELTIEFEGSAVIERQSGSPNIRVDGIVCAAPDLSANATVQTVDTIRVEGSIGDDFLTISLGGGPFAPGATSEGTVAGSEIEFSVNFRPGFDVLEIVGSAGPDLITFGAGSTATNQRAIALNQDNDAEVLVSGEQVLIATGDGGNDTLQGSAAAEPGVPSRHRSASWARTATTPSPGASGTTASPVVRATTPSTGQPATTPSMGTRASTGRPAAPATTSSKTRAAPTPSSRAPATTWCSGPARPSRRSTTRELLGP